MARFRATVMGQRGEASRLGSAKSGLHASINGWNSGVSVDAMADGEADTFVIYATSGSNRRRNPQAIGRITLDENGVPTFYSA